MKKRKKKRKKKKVKKRKNNNPQDLLNETVNNFNPQQRQQWDNLMKMFNQQNTQ